MVTEKVRCIDCEVIGINVYVPEVSVLLLSHETTEGLSFLSSNVNMILGITGVNRTKLLSCTANTVKETNKQKSSYINKSEDVQFNLT